MTTDMITQSYSAIPITTTIKVLVYPGMGTTIMYPRIGRHKMDR